MSEERIPEAFNDKYPGPAVRENFSRVCRQIEQQWGRQECTDYLESLVLVEDDRHRQDFDAAVLSDLCCWDYSTNMPTRSIRPILCRMNEVNSI